MADLSDQRPVYISAEERPHPALQMLARALIALARLRRNEQAAHREAHNPAPPASTKNAPSAEGGRP
jgi:hypothetical protein